MQSVDGFLSMGGYGFFVWPSYILAALALVGMLAASLRSLRRNRDAVERLEAARPRHRRGEGAA